MTAWVNGTASNVVAVAATVAGAVTTLTVADVARPIHGDLACLPTAGADNACATTDEIIIVSNDGSVTATDLYVTRGYLGTNQNAITTVTDADYIPSSFVWYDDGSTTDTTTVVEDEVYGSYLVKNLPMVGGTLVF